jgi:lipopolysaccharide transport system ATP-binding protein
LQTYYEMTDNVVIRVQRLSKKYVIGHQAERERYTTFRDVIARKMKSLARPATNFVRKRATLAGGESEVFWALKNVEFEVKRGEVVGIIGRNGAGKSTLLKILSRITEPSGGRVEIKGRVASLLEVGTGFHPELTGRENIYLNGAILGMKRAEIRRKFDEIVTFAEVEQFLDTPVKRYSSGMYVRLAFAVAAHVDPEILIVDEVLAVGDAEFQKKCLGKMKDAAAGQGRTVLFVSHSMNAVSALCHRGIVLHRGYLHFDGTVENALAQYLGLAERWSASTRVTDLTKPSILRVEVDEGEASNGNLKIEVEFASPWPLEPLLIGAVVHNRLGAPVFGLNTWQNGCEVPPRVRHGKAMLSLRDVSIHSGVYSVSVFLGEKERNYDILENATFFNFVSPEPLPIGLNADTVGAMRADGRWQFEIVG